MWGYDEGYMWRLRGCESNWLITGVRGLGVYDG